MLSSEVAQKFDESIKFLLAPNQLLGLARSHHLAAQLDQLAWPREPAIHQLRT